MPPAGPPASDHFSFSFRIVGHSLLCRASRRGVRSIRAMRPRRQPSSSKIIEMMPRRHSSGDTREGAHDQRARVGADGATMRRRRRCGIVEYRRRPWRARRRKYHADRPGASPRQGRGPAQGRRKYLTTAYFCVSRFRPSPAGTLMLRNQSHSRQWR